MTPRHTVTFAYSDGTIIATKEVKEGYGTYPPPLMTDNIFRGWSAPINEVNGDREVHPMIYEVSREENLFYFDSVYVEEGKEFEIALNLGGKVNVSMADIILEYDENVMTYKGCDAQESIVAIDNKDGTITVRFESTEALTEKQLLTKLRFKALKKDVYASEISLQCIDIKKDNISVTGTTINNKIYFLQEVD